MRALLYADWCQLRKALPQTLVTSFLVATVVSMGSIGDGDITASAMAVVATISALTGFFMLISLFTLDETGNWQEARLVALPVTSEKIVSARFAMMGLLQLAIALASPILATLGILLSRLLFASEQGLVVPDVATMAPGALAIALVLATIYALEMIPLFAEGLQKGRGVALAPFALMMLLALPGVRDVVQAAIDVVDPIVSGAPAWLLAVGGTALAAGVWLVALKISQVLYARREF